MHRFKAQHAREGSLEAMSDERHQVRLVGPELDPVNAWLTDREEDWIAKLSKLKETTETALATSQADVQRLAAELAESTRALNETQYELAAYKKAKAENDERFMTERDEARRAMAVSQGEVERLREAASHWASWATELVGCESPEGITELIEERERVADRALADLAAATLPVAGTQAPAVAPGTGTTLIQELMMAADASSRDAETAWDMAGLNREQRERLYNERRARVNALRARAERVRELLAHIGRQADVPQNRAVKEWLLDLAGPLSAPAADPVPPTTKGT
jgi:hypothetical protein